MIQGLYGFLGQAVALAPAVSRPALPVGYVVGHGHRRFARAGLEVTPAEAHALLRYDLFEIETILSAMVPGGTQPCQFDALASLAQDIGMARLAGSRLWECFRAGDWIGAADGFDEWRGPGLDLVGDLPAQALRRATEKANFLCAEFPAALVLPALSPDGHPGASHADPDHAALPMPSYIAPSGPLPAPEAAELEVHVGPAARRGFWPEEPDLPSEPALAPAARQQRPGHARTLVGAFGAIGLAAGGIWMMLEARVAGAGGRWAGLAMVIGATLLVFVFARKGGGALLRFFLQG